MTPAATVSVAARPTKIEPTRRMASPNVNTGSNGASQLNECAGFACWLGRVRVTHRTERACQGYAVDAPFSGVFWLVHPAPADRPNPACCGSLSEKCLRPRPTIPRTLARWRVVPGVEVAGITADRWRQLVPAVGAGRGETDSQSAGGNPVRGRAGPRPQATARETGRLSPGRRLRPHRHLPTNTHPLQ